MSAVKKFHLFMFWLNVVMTVLNITLMYFSFSPVINFVCGLVSLAGCMASWHMYKEEEE